MPVHGVLRRGSGDGWLQDGEGRRRKEGGHKAFGHVLLISCHDDSKGVGAPGWEAARDMLVLNHRDSTSVELLRCCCGNQWDQIAKEIYNYYKPDTNELGAVISSLGQFNVKSRREVRRPPAPTSGKNKAKETL